MGRIAAMLRTFQYQTHMFCTQNTVLSLGPLELFWTHTPSAHLEQPRHVVCLFAVGRPLHVLLCGLQFSLARACATHSRLPFRGHHFRADCLRRGGPVKGHGGTQAAGRTVTEHRRPDQLLRQAKRWSNGLAEWLDRVAAKRVWRSNLLHWVG